MASETTTPAETVQETSQETSTGIDENVLAALAYVFGLVSGVVVYLAEQDNDFVRFHAAQSITVSLLVFGVSIALSVVGIVLSAVAFSGSTGGFLAGSIGSLVLTLVWLVVWLGSFLLWVYLVVRAYQGRTPRIPVAAGIADRLV